MVALIPARDEADLVSGTVSALLSLSVDEVVVVDDASSDGTAWAALEAGATVLRIPVHAGKGRAVEGALARLPAADLWLLADADLGSSAAGLGSLLDEVLSGGSDLAVAVFPDMSGGGFGMVKRFAARMIRSIVGLEVREPLSGQRAVSADCLDACRPLAPGFGLETAMTIDAARGGFAIAELEVPGLTHRSTGRSVRGFLHRGRQGLDILIAVTARAVRLR